MTFINKTSNSVLIFLHVFHFGLNASLPWVVNGFTVMTEEGQQAWKIKGFGRAGNFPGGPVAPTLCSPVQGAQV